MEKVSDNAVRISSLELAAYLVKCFIGVAIGYSLYKAFPERGNQYAWVLISIVLSITHDNNSTVAFDRMKGNIIGSAVGLITFLIHSPPNLLTISVGVAMTISLCFFLKLIGVARIAIVGFIVVMLYEEAHSSWNGAAYRMASVVAGCLIGLIINYTFLKLTALICRPISRQPVRPSSGRRADDPGE